MKSKSELKRIAATNPDALLNEIFSLQKKLDKAIETLEFYGRNIKAPHDIDNPMVSAALIKDGGEKARQCLKEFDENP